METIYFTDWTLQKLHNAFGLREVDSLPALETRLNMPDNLDDLDRAILDRIRHQLKGAIDTYQEQELILKCIGGIITITDLDGKTFRAFSERLIEAKIDGYTLKGKPDLFIAKGIQEPETPFFCLHEYKRGIESSGDPAGQCLAAMLVAQNLNGDAKQAIYGSYVLGQQWVFMTLVGRRYAQSVPYIVTRNDIFDIVRLLRGLRMEVARILHDDDDEWEDN